jgi:hypothetical protein
MISGVDAISERRTAYTLSWDPGSRYTGLLRDIYGPAQAFLVCPRCEFARSGFSISDEMHSGATRLDVGVKAEMLDRFLPCVRALGASGNSAAFRERAMRASNRILLEHRSISFPVARA